MRVESPFVPDPALAARRGALRATHADGFAARLAAELAAAPDPRHPAAVVPAAAAVRLAAATGLASIDDVMILALDAAAALARPPISGYRVGIVARLATSGDLVLGGNLEFPGSSIANTVHGEGFVQLVARARGEAVAVLAATQARPCAHCRQLLAETDGAGALRLIDPQGHDLGLGELYPWAFAPGDLGEPGARPGSVGWPELDVTDPSLPEGVAALLVAAGRRAHAPYSASPAAVVVRLADGRLASGAVLESVAFNPTVGPLADAVVGLVAAGTDPAAIREAWLAERAGARVRHEAQARELLAAAAPGATLRAVTWA